MTIKRMIISVMAVAISLAGSPALATIDFNDGQTHDIDYEINDEVWVDYDAPGMETTVNLLNGGSISHSLFPCEDSRINILGGSIEYDVWISDSSQVKISGGSIGYHIWAFGSSQVDIFGGSMKRLYACDNSQVNFSGGSVRRWLSAYDSGQVNISGGSIRDYLLAYGNSQINICGGFIGDGLVASSNSIITIHGSDFAVDGQPFGYGILSSIHGGDWRPDEPRRHLTGMLASGEPIDNDFYIGYDARIVLIPKPAIIHVDDDATGNNNGSSWVNAYNYLQDALAAAWSGDEIRVAEGIYTPDSNLADPNGSGDREATFQLQNGVTIKGGYAGYGEPDPNVRDIELYETILSGDLNGNDVDVNDPADLLDEPTRAENSYHVVTGTGTDKTAILDGFTITGGNANGPHDPYRFERGGGMYCNFYSSPTVINCTFRGNIAVEGGGLYIYWDENMVLTNCAFIGNYAGSGGGMLAMRSRVTLTNCAFSGNAAQNGGGMRNQDGGPTLTNCTFSANSAAGNGGGMVNFMSSPTMINCTFTGNRAEYGGAINSYLECTTVVTNSILWDNTTAQGSEIYLADDPHYSSDASISYCNVEGGITGVYVGGGCRLNWGQGNIDSDPLFQDPDGNDNIPGTEDDNLRLSAASPCIDAGDPNYVAEPNETDLDGRPRVIGGRIDMGAYELPVPAEVRIAPRTINLASKGKWITCYIWLPEDYNVADIEPNSVLLEDEIKPEEFSVDQQKQVAVLRFSREEVQPILEVGEVELTITGQLSDGTVFEGTDTIKVLNKAGKK